MFLVNSLPSVIVALVVVVVSCALALFPYFLARRILLPRVDEQSKDLAGSVVFRVSALHSLILALVFAQEVLNFHEAREEMTREAALVGDIFYDLERYDPKQTRSVRGTLADYTRIVLARELEALGRDSRLDKEAWESWESAYTYILDLVPENPRQEALKEIMLEQVRELSALRISRESTALLGVHVLFLFAAVSGIVIIAVGYFPFPPTPVNLTLLLAFGAYTGIVLYFILAFASPFSGAAYVEPIRFERLYEGMLQSLT